MLLVLNIILIHCHKCPARIDKRFIMKRQN